MKEISIDNRANDSIKAVIASNSGNTKSSWKAFCERSSIPGLSYIVDRSLPIWIRIFWLLVILTLLGILIYATGTLSASVFSQKKVYSSMTIVTNESLPFPEIHICDSGFFSRKRLYGKNKRKYTILSRAKIE